MTTMTTTTTTTSSRTVAVRDNMLLTSSCGTLVTVATCNLNQWALDFDGNVQRIYESCVAAKKAGATYRLGPELEIPGYGCEDHFLEHDTFDHCWQSLAELLRCGATDGMLCDFGMPVLKGAARYNCRVLVVNRRILQIRPKMSMADNGNYRESRYFTPYRPPSSSSSQQQQEEGEKVTLPTFFQQQFGQVSAPFGTQFLQLADGVSVGCESCEELWAPQSTHINLALQGVDIIGNGSGSHHELRKLDTRLQLVKSATAKCGGVYLYSNQRGCDGGRTYYDGGALIACNGRILAQAPQFALEDVQVITATIDLDDVRSFRAAIPSVGMQAQLLQDQGKSRGARSLDCSDNFVMATSTAAPTLPLDALRVHTPQEECCVGPACWLWDYLRRSGAAGYFLPLSGGADSSSVAAIVGVMCRMAAEAARNDPKGGVATEVRRLCASQFDVGENPDWIPADATVLTNCVLHTTFMGTRHSSQVTTSRAQRLGDALGAYHLTLRIDAVVQAVVTMFAAAVGKTPRFAKHGGTMAEDLALQNIQARLRMVTAYLLAQLLPWVRGRSGFLLVLSSANVDEGLRGYLTKYDCSSADLNPIGAISKGDLKKMLAWASEEYQWPVLREIAAAPPTAELRPLDDDDDDNAGRGGVDGAYNNAASTAEHSQLDEEEMGMTYAELGWFGTLRKVSRCGPVSMFRKLCVAWAHLSPRVVADKVKRFFRYYAMNRHKMCTLTPAYHAEGYSPDDNRFDLRPFLYNVQWPRQFAVLDLLVEAAESSHQEEAKAQT